MKKLLILLALLLLPLSARAQTRLMVVSDTHYLAPELYKGSALFLQAMRQTDGKVPQYGEELMAALVAQAEALRPDALVITGDLAFNGERASHIALAEWLRKIEDAGVPVYVIPGNHDINVYRPVRFLENGWEYTAPVTQEEFAAIYAPFLLPKEGGDNAGLSYHAEIGEKLWLAMLDVSFYQGSAQTFGLYTADHRDFLKGVLDQAQAAGVAVISATHQSVLAHTQFNRDGFLTMGSDQLAAQLVQGGVRLNLSGHLHIQHTAQANGLTDIALGAFCITPHRYAWVTVADDGSISYEARALDDRYLPEGFAETSLNWFKDVSAEKTRAGLLTLGLPEEEISRMTAFSSRFSAAYFAGTYGSRDPSWREDPDYLLWLRPEVSSHSAYMTTIMDEENSGLLTWECPAAPREAAP